MVGALAPGGVVVRDTCVQYKIVVASGDRDRVELNRARRRTTSRTASTPPSSERAGARKWRATRNRRAAFAGT
jgi:hypothetical protein